LYYIFIVKLQTVPTGLSDGRHPKQQGQINVFSTTSPLNCIDCGNKMTRQII